MFGLSAWHLAILVVVGLFVFGPERLPTLIRDLGKALRQVRQTANSMQEDLKAELGPEVGDLDLRSLHPRTFVEKHLFGEGEEDPLGLDFLKKDAEPLISFDKPKSANGSHSNGSKPKPEVEPESPREIRFDADAT
ncbi:MAG TPA: sec-independent translocase [Frankiaceae bacterium]|jgi:sec-independent protein translocase protein TatB|nr:sec-independent translocase [Frankiaceae bacterium]